VLFFTFIFLFFAAFSASDCPRQGKFKRHLNRLHLCDKKRSSKGWKLNQQIRTGLFSQGKLEKNTQLFSTIFAYFNNNVSIEK